MYGTKTGLFTKRPLMQKTIHKTKHKNLARLLTTMLMLHRGNTVSHVARTLCCAHSLIGRWMNQFTQSGGPLPSERGRRRPFELFAHCCVSLLSKHFPSDFGYQRCRWSTELLAIKIVMSPVVHYMPQPSGDSYL